MGVTRALPYACLLCIACGPPSIEQHAKIAETTLVIKVDGQVPERSRVIIDDEVVFALDIVALHGVRLRQGQHRLTVTAPGFLSFDEGFALTGKRFVIVVSLRRRPD